MALLKRRTPTRGRRSVVRGKDAVLSCRIPSTLRDQLKDRARVQKLTLSDVVAITLDRGLRTATVHQ